MTVSHKEAMAKLDPERRERIRKEAQVIIAEEMTLRDLRKAQQLTQERLAKELGVKQDSVSRLEHRADMLLSTMTNYVEAMGGTLRLVAEFPNRPPYTVKLGDLDNGSEIAELAESTR
jgi:transcriptional regulator with XRE-family HTH domain